MSCSRFETLVGIVTVAVVVSFGATLPLASAAGPSHGDGLGKRSEIRPAAETSLVSASLKGSAQAMGAPFRIRWTIGTDLPMNWKGGAAGDLEGRVVYTGGMQSPWRAPRETILVDPTAADLVYCWLPELPVSTEYTAGVSVRNAFYVLGGRAGAARRRVFRLTRQDAGPLGPFPGGRSCEGDWAWEEIASMGKDHVLPTCAAVGDTIVVTGGILGSGDGVESYSTSHPELGWTELPPAPVMRASAAASARGKFHLFGGIEGTGGQTTARASSLDMTTHRWEEIEPISMPLRYANAVTYQDRYVIILGGASVEDPDFGPMDIPGGPVGQLSPFVIIYDADLGEYSQISEVMPVGVATLGAVLLEDTIYVIGGETRDPHTSNILQIGKISAIEH